MSVSLIGGEQIIRSYEYATAHSKGLGATNGSKTLIVTNKRIIHRESFSGSKGSGISTSEMPIANAKYVNTNLRVTRYPALLVMGIVLVICALIMLFTVEDSPAVALIPLVIAAVCFIAFALKKTYMFSCSIDTDTHINNAFAFSSLSGNSVSRGFWSKLGRANKTFFIRVKVTPGIVEEMANELGSVIAAAANGDFDEVPVSYEE